MGPSQTPMSLVDEHDVWVVANLKETQLDEVEVGQPVEIAVAEIKAVAQGSRRIDPGSDRCTVRAASSG